MIIYPVYRKPEKETAISLFSVSAWAVIAEQGGDCFNVCLMAVWAGVHSDEILVVPGVRLGRLIIRALCPIVIGIIVRGLINSFEMVVGARSQGCCRDGADQHQCTDESQRLFHGIPLLK